MDAFYAAIEQLDHPELRGKPVLVGPDSDRGVVLTASYEARPFGVGSAQPMARARRMCPRAVIVPPRFERYQQVSALIMRVFRDFAAQVEALSLDEAFLDMSGAESIFGPPEIMGRRLKAAVREATGLTVTVGVSGTKYVAKVASGYFKPDGLTIVPQGEARAWLAPLPVSRLWGAGAKTQTRLRALGLETIGDVAATDLRRLTAALGAAGRHFRALAHAEDPRPVVGSRAPKSIGCEHTLERDIATRAELERELRVAAETVGQRLRAKGYLARAVRVKLKRSDFRLFTRQRALRSPTDLADVLYRTAARLLDEFPAPGRVRLVGVAGFDLTRASNEPQLELLDEGHGRHGSRADRLERTLDQVAEKFGARSIRRGADLLKPGNVTPAPTLDFLDDAEER
jgi:DNA polymerase IV